MSRAASSQRHPVETRLLPEDVGSEIFRHLIDELESSSDVFSLKARARMCADELFKPNFRPYLGDLRVYEEMGRRCDQAEQLVASLMAKPRAQRHLKEACRLIPWISPDRRSELVQLHAQDVRNLDDSLSELGRHRAMLSAGDVSHLMDLVGTSGNLLTHQRAILRGFLSDTTTSLDHEWLKLQIDRCALGSSEFWDVELSTPDIAGAIFPWLMNGSAEARRAIVNMIFEDPDHHSMYYTVRSMVKAWESLDVPTRRLLIERIFALPAKFRYALDFLAARSCDLNANEREAIAGRLVEDARRSVVFTNYFYSRRICGYGNTDAALEDRFVDGALSSFEGLASRTRAITYVLERDGGLRDTPLHSRLVDVFNEHIKYIPDPRASNNGSDMSDTVSAHLHMWGILTNEQKNACKDRVTKSAYKSGLWEFVRYIEKINPSDREWVVNMVNAREPPDKDGRIEQSTIDLYAQIIPHIRSLSPECRRSVVERVKEFSLEDFVVERMKNISLEYLGSRAPSDCLRDAVYALKLL